MIAETIVLGVWAYACCCVLSPTTRANQGFKLAVYISIAIPVVLGALAFL